MIRPIALALLIVMASSAAHSETQPYAKVRGWTISYNISDTACTAQSQANNDGTSIFFGWNYRMSIWYVALLNPTWKLKVGQKIPAAVYVDNDLLVRRRMEVLTTNSVVLPINKREANESTLALRELGEGKELRVRWSGGTVTRMGLYGSRAALSKMVECADRISSVAEAETQLGDAAPPRREPKVAGYSVEIIPRERALVFVTNMFVKAGITGFELLSLQQGEKYPNVVRYRFEDGSRGSFAASRGQTMDADSYVNKVTNANSKTCAGTFGSIVEKLPSTDGTVLRKVTTRCTNSDSLWSSETTVIRRPDGLLMDLTQAYSGLQAFGAADDAPDRSPSTSGGLVDAALRVVE